MKMRVVQSQPVGDLLREWRSRRRMSQLDLACEAVISTKHLSFLETGRSLPSRDMLLHLAEHLDIPLRERNVLLIAAGYAPIFPERSLEDPAFQAARQVVDQVLAGHEPYPALAIDRHFILIASNRAFMKLFAGVSSTLLQPPVNVLRLCLHPEGLAPRIANLHEWSSHLLARLRRQIGLTADQVLVDLLGELSGYPANKPRSSTLIADHASTGVAVPLQLITNSGYLAFLSTMMVFGTPVDITLSELSIKFFFPANAATAKAMHRSAGVLKTKSTPGT